MPKTIIRTKNVPTFYGLLAMILVILAIMFFGNRVRGFTYDTLVKELTNKIGGADQTIYVTLNKIALATESYVSAYGSAPNGKNFINDIPMAYPALALDVEDPGCKINDDTCLFGVKGTILPVKCGDNHYKGSRKDKNQCYFYYERIDLDGDGKKDFRISAKSHLKVGKIFIYESRGENSGKIKGRIL